MTSRNEAGIIKWWLASLLAFGAVLLIGVLIILLPENIPDLQSRSNPAATYAQALERVEALRAQESSAMNPVCRLQLMTHAKKVEHAIILVHGYTNCPQELNLLGQRFYDRGYNVVIAPLPHHGLADPMTEAHTQLRAEELAVYADTMVDLAHGLGESVTMMGISGGGVTTAWAAQNRSDLEAAVIISPAFGYKQIPTPLTAAAMNLYTALPNSYIWWDPVHREDVNIPYGYIRYATHALAQFIRLGYAVRENAQLEKPSAQKIVVVTNPNDMSVNNDLTKEIINIWQTHSANLTTYEFDAALKLPHDMIDPTTPDLPYEEIYSRLIELSGQ